MSQVTGSKPDHWNDFHRHSRGSKSGFQNQQLLYHHSAYRHIVDETNGITGSTRPGPIAARYPFGHVRSAAGVTTPTGSTIFAGNFEAALVRVAR